MSVDGLHQVAPAIAAERSVGLLQTSSDVLAICLVGSVARGDERPDSDVDLLVISQRSSRVLRSIFAETSWGYAVSLTCKTPEQIQDSARRGSLFLEHARTEGRVVHDPHGILAGAFETAVSAPLDTDREIRRRLASLRHYRDLSRFGGNYLFALAHLYGIAKGLAIARCIELEQTTFVKADALDRLSEARPILRSEIAFIRSLRPFYDLTRGHEVDELPFQYIGASQETRRAVDAAARLANDAR